MVVVGQLWNFVASLENLMANGKRDLDSPRFAIALSKAYRRASQRERNQRERSNR
jgi:ribonuclease P protein component